MSLELHRSVNLEEKKLVYNEIVSFVEKHFEIALGLDLDQLKEIDYSAYREYCRQNNINVDDITKENIRSQVNNHRFSNYFLGALIAISIGYIGIGGSKDSPSLGIFSSSLIWLGCVSVTEVFCHKKKLAFNRVRSQVLNNYVEKNNILE